MGTVDRNYNQDWKETNEEEYNYTVMLLNLNGGIQYFEDLNKCCQYYEDKTAIRYKKLNEENKLKSAQEDFE